MKARYILFMGLLSLAAGGLTSCSDPVYATVETATKTVENTLPLLLSVVDVAVTSPGSTYSVAAGAVFKGSLSSPVGGTMTWTPNNSDSSRPFNPPGLQCFGGLALFGTHLYGGFFDTSGNPSLWQSDTSYSFGSGSAVQVPIAAGKQVTFLQSAGGVLFMGVAVYNASLPTPQYQYELDSSPDGTTWTATNLTALAYPVSGVGYDGANFWTASGSTLYKSGSASFAGYSTLATITGGDRINGLFVDPVNAGRIFGTTKTRGIFYSLNSGSTWINLTDSPSGSSSTYPAGFLCVAGPVDTGTRYYLAGSDGFGYYTLDTVGSTWTRFGDSTILLYTSSVRRIVVDTAGQGNVLIGTNRNGLWRAVFDTTTGTVLNGTNQYWIHE